MLINKTVIGKMSFFLLLIVLFGCKYTKLKVPPILLGNEIDVELGEYKIFKNKLKYNSSIDGYEYMFKQNKYFDEIYVRDKCYRIVRIGLEKRIRTDMKNDNGLIDDIIYHCKKYFGEDVTIEEKYEYMRNSFFIKTISWNIDRNILVQLNYVPFKRIKENRKYFIDKNIEYVYVILSFSYVNK